MVKKFDFTEKEIRLLEAINNDGFFDEHRFDEIATVWAEFLETWAKEAGFDTKVARGVVSSLIKKKVMVYSSGEKSWDDVNNLRDNGVFYIKVSAVEAAHKMFEELEDEEVVVSFDEESLKKANAEVAKMREAERDKEIAEMSVEEALVEYEKLHGEIEDMKITKRTLERYNIHDLAFDALYSRLDDKRREFGWKGLGDKIMTTEDMILKSMYSHYDQLFIDIQNVKITMNTLNKHHLMDLGIEEKLMELREEKTEEMMEVYEKIKKHEKDLDKLPI